MNKVAFIIPIHPPKKNDFIFKFVSIQELFDLKLVSNNIYEYFR